MHIFDTLLLVVKSEGENGLRGRTLLQKKVYFLSVLRGREFGFTAHHYGPYSSYVAGNLNSLVNCGFLKEVTETFSTDSGDPNLFGEVRRHTYFLTNDAEEIWSETEEQPDYDEWKSTLDQINDQNIAHDFNKLSIAAKVHYIVNREGKCTLKQVDEIAQDYGWQVEPKDIKSVYSFLKDLKLITSKKS